jgi:hypothetical protein
VGSQGDLQTIVCGPGTVAFFAAAGTTYYVLAIDDQFDGGGNGGLLSISFNEFPTPTLDAITVNPFGVFNARTGVATLSGTYTCTNGDFISVSGNARQNGPVDHHRRVLRFLRLWHVRWSAPQLVGRRLPAERRVQRRQGDDSDICVRVRPIPVRHWIRRADSSAARALESSRLFRG